MYLSIIIPTLNEEQYLPKLLGSIESQDFINYEIIVADAGSEDRTIEIARKHNCKIIPGGLPAKARNNGARIAQGNLLLFLDADVVLPEGFLAKSLNEFKKRNLEIASFKLSPQRKAKIFGLLLNLCYNFPIVLMEKILPHASMAILIDKGTFEKLNGFDETIIMAEDHDLARRAKKIAKFGILRSGKILVSDRRFKKDGWIRTYFKYLFCEIYMVFIGPVRSGLEYKFDHYSKKKKN